jgi:hypothetical protein
MYGRANFDLLRIRVLSPPKKLKRQEAKARNKRNQQKAGTRKRKGTDTNAPTFSHTTARVIEVAEEPNIVGVDTDRTRCLPVSYPPPRGER